MMLEVQYKGHKAIRTNSTQEINKAGGNQEKCCAVSTPGPDLRAGLPGGPCCEWIAAFRNVAKP